MKYTPNLNLKKPDGTDIVDIDDFNLNFDTLDTEILKRVEKTKKLTTSYDLNSLANTGFFNVENPVNAPSGIAGWCYIISIKYSESTTYLAQILIPFGSNRMFFRRKSSTWQIWIELANKEYFINELTKKVDKISGKGLSTNDYTTAEKQKLAGISTGANNYTHPSAHSANMITENTSRRFVSDTEKAEWNTVDNKVDKISGKRLSTNDYTTTEKNKLAGIATGANKTTINNTLTSTSTTQALSAKQGKTLKDDLDEHKAEKVQHLSYAIATGTNSYAVNIPGITALVEGMSVKINFTSANTGTSTLNINSLGAKSIRKSNGNTLSSGNIKAGQICHLVYTGSVFQLLGEGGEYGTAQAQDVLKGKTIGTEDGIKTGTMPNRGSKTFTPSDSTQTGSSGYYSGITVNPRPNLSGNATTSQVLSGRTFYGSNYTKQTGTMTNRGAVSKTLTTQGGSYTIPSGYHNGSGIVKAQFANLIAENIKNGVNIGGIEGSYDGPPIVFNMIRASEATIELGFRPKALMLASAMEDPSGYIYSDGTYSSGTAYNRTLSGYNSPRVTILSNGFYFDGSTANWYYLVIG